MDRLGLFPLSLVLFPESLFPLHIFEEKFKLLINNCINTYQVFGINLVTTTKIFETGCTALVHEIVRTYDDGKMDIVVKGMRRYKLRQILTTENPYQEGDIAYFDDVDEMMDVDLLDKCIDQYNYITDIVKSVAIDKIDPANFPVMYPSYTIAQKAGLTNIQKQKLLELNSENERLSFLNEHLKMIIPMLKETEYISEIIKNDGYYNPRKF